MNRRLATVLAATALLLAVATPGRAAADSLHIVLYGGGSPEDLISRSGTDVASMWIITQGRLIGFTTGAPDFVNAEFRAALPGGNLPAGGPVILIVKTGSPAPPTSIAAGATAAASPTPRATPSPSPFDPKRPVIEGLAGSPSSFALVFPTQARVGLRWASGSGATRIEYSYRRVIAGVPERIDLSPYFGSSPLRLEEFFFVAQIEVPKYDGILDFAVRWCNDAGCTGSVPLGRIHRIAGPPAVLLVLNEYDTAIEVTAYNISATPLAVQVSSASAGANGTCLPETYCMRGQFVIGKGPRFIRTSVVGQPGVYVEITLN